MIFKCDRCGVINEFVEPCIIVNLTENDNTLPNVCPYGIEDISPNFKVTERYILNKGEIN